MSISAPAHAQEAHGHTAQSVARATILRSAALRVGGQPRLEMAMQPDSVAAREPKQTTRLCDAENPNRCTLIVFDLP